MAAADVVGHVVNARRISRLRLQVESSIGRAEADRDSILQEAREAREEARVVKEDVGRVRKLVEGMPKPGPGVDAEALVAALDEIKDQVAGLGLKLGELAAPSEEEDAGGWKGGDPREAREAREAKADKAAQMELAFVGHLRDRYGAEIAAEIMDSLRPTDAWRRAKKNPERAQAILQPVLAQAEAYRERLQRGAEKKSAPKEVSPWDPGY